VLVTGGVMLFVEFGSVVGLPTLAAFVMPPLTGAVTVSVRLVLPPAAREPSDQITLPAPNTPPPLALTNVDR